MSNIYRAFEAPQRLGPERQQQPYRAHYLPGAAVQRTYNELTTLVLALEPKPVLILCNPRPT